MTITSEQRQRLRSRFPALSGPTVFLENAGGSQVPGLVADRIRDYMVSSYVQLGAGYPLSMQATSVVAAAHEFVRLLMNGEQGEVILGPSTSSLIRTLALAYGKVLRPGQEVIIAETGHEANMGPWKELQNAGLSLRWWKMDPTTQTCSLECLEEILNERTAIVAFPHVSNLLGEIVDIQAITELAHGVGARVVADGVAFAPHRAIDVTKWGVDYYAYSTYKVYGPHMAALWGTHEALAELTGPNHFFVADDDLPYKFELGGVQHEGCAGLLALAEYLDFLVERESTGPMDRAAVEQAFDIMTACELPLQERLIEYLLGRKDVRIIGPKHAESSRVGTVSFVHESLKSQEIARVVDRSGVAIRHGHMYAYHLCEALGLDLEDGVVRVSLVHYNTPEEIERLIDVLDEAMG